MVKRKKMLWGLFLRYLINKKKKKHERYILLSTKHSCQYLLQIIKTCLFIFIVNCISTIWHRRTPGDHKLSKLLSTLPKDASEQVCAFLAETHLEKIFFKKFMYIFQCKTSPTTTPSPHCCPIPHLDLMILTKKKFQYFLK